MLSLAGVSVDDVAVIVLSVLSVVNETLIDSAERLERTFGALASVFVATGSALDSVFAVTGAAFTSVRGAVLVTTGAALTSVIGAVLVATGVVLASEVATGFALAVDSATTVSGCVVSKFVVAVEPLFATLALVSIVVDVVCVGSVVVFGDVFSSAWAI